MGLPLLNIFVYIKIFDTETGNRDVNKLT